MGPHSGSRKVIAMFMNLINAKLLFLILTTLGLIAGELAWQRHRQAAIDAQVQANQQRMDYAEHHPVQVELGATKALQSKWK
jgi:hypothetical protein